MCVVLHCRVLFWCTSSLYMSWYIPLYTCTLMQCLSGSLQSQYGELAINYQPILFQANLLSCLSTTMGLVHEPPLPNMVVNPQQSEFGAQCGDQCGRWTGPQTHRCETQLLGDPASHPTLRRKHHLAHVVRPVANMRSHMKNDFSQQKNTSECTFAVQLTGQHQTVQDPITHTSSAGGLCPVTYRGCCDQYSHNPLHSQGECGDNKEPHNEEGSSTTIPEWIGSLLREVVPGPTHEDEDCTVNLVIVPGALNSNSARGTELHKCKFHTEYS